LFPIATAFVARSNRWTSLPSVLGGQQGHNAKHNHMGTKQKKTEGDGSKPITSTPKPRAVAKTKPAARVVAATPAVATPKPVRTVKKKPAPELTLTLRQEDVALRAYFIAEKRQKLGLPGDSTSDWVQAEAELTSEHRQRTLN
jgi:hypothetical protein